MAPAVPSARAQPSRPIFFSIVREPQQRWRRQPSPQSPSSNDPAQDNRSSSLISAPTVSAKDIGRPTNLSIAIITAGSCTVVLLGLVLAFLIYKRKDLSFSSAFKCCRRPSRQKKLLPSSAKGTLLDDPTWGTGPTRIIYVESVHGMLNDYDPPGSFQSVNLATEPDLTSLVASTEKLAVEERDITSGYSLDLADWEKRHTLIANFEDASSVINISFFRPFHANEDTSKTVPRMRNRQGSDASDSSSSSDVMECFSPATSGSTSSMTSLSSTDDDIYEDEAFEVGRAQTQSIEFKRGILLSCQQSNGTLVDELAQEATPTVIVWEPATLLTLDSKHSSNTITSLSTSNSIRFPPSLSECQTIPSLSSRQVPENSSATIDSLVMSNSNSGRSLYTTDDNYLLPPIPYLMVTRPSNSSICTLSSATSSVSVDLNDFPLPPLPAKPLHLQLLERIQTRKREWEGGHADLSPVHKFQKRRSTVEQFIMMYATV